MYARVEEGLIVSLGAKPSWFSGHPDEGGRPLTDGELAQFGYLPVVDTVPEYDEDTHAVSRNDHTNWVVHADGVEVTYTLRALTPEEIATREQIARDLIVQAALTRAQEIAARKVIEEIVMDLPQNDALSVSALFPEWEPAQTYKQNSVLRYNGGLLRVLQDHTSQADWLPENTQALYTAHFLPEEIPEWTMPAGGHDAPNIGDKRWYNDKCWRSLINGNSTVPGSDPRWWEEFTCP